MKNLNFKDEIYLYSNQLVASNLEQKSIDSNASLESISSNSFLSSNMTSIDATIETITTSTSTTNDYYNCY